MTTGGNGRYGGLDDISLSVATILASLTAIAWVHAAEVILQIFLTFKKYRGLYFWSLLGSSLGVILHGLGNIFKFFEVTKSVMVPVVIITIGWYAMVTGQSLVLYSRLHLLLRDSRKLKWILAMILIDAAILHFPTTTFTLGTNSGARETFQPLYFVYEKIQITGFTIQECILSFFYIWETRKLLKSGCLLNKKGAVRVLKHLIMVNVIIVLMDIALLTTEYAGYFFIESTMKPTIYAMKLRFEFSILNKFMRLIQSPETTHTGYRSYAGENGTIPTRDGTLRGAQEEIATTKPKRSIFSRRRNSDNDNDLLVDEPGGIVATTEIDVNSVEVSGKEEKPEHIESEVNSDFFHLPGRHARVYSGARHM